MKTIKRSDFPQKVHFSNTVPLDTLRQFDHPVNCFLPKFRNKSLFLNFSTNCFFFNKFLWTSKNPFWQACRNHFCQKLYYVIAQSPELIRKVCIFHKTLVFSLCSSGQKDVSSQKIAESFSWKVLQDFCSKSENQNKKLIFQRKSPKMFFWTRILRSSTLPEVFQTNWKKIVYNSKFCFFFQNIPVDSEEAGVTTLPSVFARSQSKVKIWKLFHSV